MLLVVKLYFCYIFGRCATSRFKALRDMPPTKVWLVCPKARLEVKMCGGAFRVPRCVSISEGCVSIFVFFMPLGRPWPLGLDAPFRVPRFVSIFEGCVSISEGCVSVFVFFCRWAGPGLRG